tara:strand:- start:361 stop:678 length:318 start_codon:yes stop_codon:yes gene_type:complete
MMFIENGKKYDTATATCVADWSNDLPVTEFGFASEQLYCTARGAYFLVGEGGAASSWGKRSGNSSTLVPGSGAYAMKSREALNWLVAQGFHENAASEFDSLLECA